MKIKPLFNSLFGLLVVACISGCGPRGESKSLQEILSTAKTRYSSSDTAGLDGEVSGGLSKAVSIMDALENESAPADAQAKCSSLAEVLTSFERKSGYTSRASLSELSQQFRAFGTGTAAYSSTGVKLVMARTYNLLASELETTRFGIKE